MAHHGPSTPSQHNLRITLAHGPPATVTPCHLPQSLSEVGIQLTTPRAPTAPLAPRPLASVSTFSLHTERALDLPLSSPLYLP